METPLLGDDFFMRKAIQLAELAYDEEEVPIGALIVHGTEIIGKGYNQTERLKDSTCACRNVGNYSSIESPSEQIFGRVYYVCYHSALRNVCRCYCLVKVNESGLWSI